MPHRLSLPALACLALLLLPAAAKAGGRVPVYPLPPGADLRSNILFESVIPLNDLSPGRWTDAQKKEMSYFRERMKKDPRIFLLLRVSIDPIGSPQETEAWAMAMAQGLAGRLQELGIPQDRMLVVPPEKDRTLFDEARWGAFAGRQKVTIRGMAGGDWLRRREAPAPVAIPLPKEQPAFIDQPKEGTTDRANHVLRGSVKGGVRTVAIVVGQETHTAPVYDGVFEVPISFRPGENRITVTGLDAYGRAIRVFRTVRYVPPRPDIEITAPPAGFVADTTLNPVVTVRGRTLSRTKLRSVVLIQNGIPRRIRLSPDGTFEQQAVLITDEDRFQAEALDENEQTGTSEVRTTFSKGISERPLMAILNWDEDDVDLDLHVRDMAGGHSYFDAPDATQSATAVPDGRVWLENKNGFGPEVFAIERNTQGEYAFSAEYYRGKKPCRAWLTVVLHAGSPSRKLVRFFGPIEMKPGTPARDIVRITLPQGTILDATGEKERVQP